MVAGFGSALAAGRRNAALRASFSGATLPGGAGRCLSTADHAAPGGEGWGAVAARAWWYSDRPALRRGRGLAT